ncbi:IclR family transcriptional regulator [Rummeliibacillus sp. JY-2-4R]
MEGQKTKEKRKYSVPAVENAFTILKLLSRKSFRESTVTEIANALSLSPATCYRILQSLEELSIVRYLEEKKRYTLGPYLVVLGERAKEHLDYLSIIMPYLEKLTKETGMTSMLVNKISDEQVAITAKVEASNFGVSVSIGRHFSITDGSYGMCFLAYMDQIDRKYHLKHYKGKSFTQEEIDLLEIKLEKVRNDGYYISYYEGNLKGICGIAVPIFTTNNKVDMSISVVGLTAQYDDQELNNKGKLMKETAEEISSKIRI